MTKNMSNGNDAFKGVSEGKSADWNEFWGGDHIISGGEGTDTITLGAAQTVPDYLSFGGQDSIAFNLSSASSNDTISLNIRSGKMSRYKYSEEKILNELTDYIASTYGQHYSAGDDKIQTLDLIEACGDGEAFCRSNILKYASRYDRKGTSRRDILKILHYAVLLLHFNDKNAQREIYPQ
tara:strand:- start:1401 stop:1940 length:540 start_codon:yes stop_codon:yes gene_type:complete